MFARRTKIFIFILFRLRVKKLTGILTLVLKVKDVMSTLIPIIFLNLFGIIFYVHTVFMLSLIVDISHICIRK